MYQIKKWRNDMGDKTLEEIITFDNLTEAKDYYRQYRISYGAGAVFFTLDPVEETLEAVSD